MNRRLVLTLGISLLATTLTLAAPPRLSDRTAGPSVPTGYNERWDGPVYMQPAPDGVLWAVWPYRRGLETDLAIAHTIGRTWTVPVLVGNRNGAAVRDPRLAFVGEAILLIWWEDGPAQNDERAMLMVGWHGSWIGPMQLNQAGTTATHPNFFESDAGSATIGWVGCDGKIDGTNVQIKPKDPEPEGGTTGPDPFPNIVFNDRPAGSGSGSGSGSGVGGGSPY